MPATRNSKGGAAKTPGRPPKTKRGPKAKTKAPPSDNDEEDSVKGLLDGQDDLEDEDPEDITITAEEAKDRVATFRAMGAVKSQKWKKGQNIIILPHGMREDEDDLTKHWKAKITDIRADSKRTLHFGIVWYYQASEVEPLDIPKSQKFDPDICGEMELITTTHEDVMTEENIVQTFELYHLSDSVTQEIIPEDEFYTRTSFNVKTRKLKTNTGLCNLCNLPYLPETESRNDVQNFCPCCGKWFHQRCLRKGHAWKQVDEDDDLADYLVQNLQIGPEQPRNSPRKPLKEFGPVEEEKREILYRIAGRQIIRGGSHGVAGLVKAVCAARRLYREMDEFKEPLRGNQWTIEVGQEVIEKLREEDETITACFKCPECNRAI